jgi:hypothetical protein
MGYFSKRLVIHPEDKNDLVYWTKKWGVNVKQINEAIIDTGSLKLQDIKNRLIKNGEIVSVSYWIHKLFKSPMRL